MAGLTPTETATRFFAAADIDDVETVAALSSDSVEFCDEISRGWARLDEAGVRNYSEVVSELVTESRSLLSATRERILGDVATVTGQLLQSYVLNGEPRAYRFLVSVVLTLDGDSWKLVLGHLTPVTEG